MKKYCHISKLFLYFMLIFITLLSLRTSEAYASERMNEPNEKLTLLSDTPVYDNPSVDNGPVGVIAALQTVEVVQESTNPLLLSVPNAEYWYHVRTYLGQKWIQRGPAIIKEPYYPVRVDISFTNTEEIYDLPRYDLRSGAQLSPQKVTAVGTMFICDDNTPDLSPPTDSCKQWFRVITFIGEKWIAPAKFVGHYESKDAFALRTPTTSNYQAKFQSSISELEPLFAQFTVKALSLHSENGILRLEVRKLYRHRDKLTNEEIEALKNAIFQSIGGPFPLSISTYTISSSDKPEFEGYILSIDKTTRRVLVVNYNKKIGIDSIPDASWFSFEEDSTIHLSGESSQLTFDDLRFGQRVEVWAAPFKLMSYPGQCSAYEVAIVDKEKLYEEGIPLNIILGSDLTHIDKIGIELKNGKSLFIQDSETIQAISNRLQNIQLKASSTYPDPGKVAYTITLYHDDKKVVYSSDLVLQMLAYYPTDSTMELDTFINNLAARIAN